MKKITLFIALATITLSANAKVLRVSNVAGSSAPYTNYYDAQNDAVDGDTIMFDGSKTPYCADGDTLKIGKRVTIIGPGYFLTENGINNENGATANFSLIQSGADGVVISGVVANKIMIKANNNVITRNYVSGIFFNYNTTKNIIHQNFINGGFGLYTSYPGDNAIIPSYIQITNNIFATWSRLQFIDHATIKNNTFTDPNGYDTFVVTNSTFENNLGKFSFSGDGCTILNNLKIGGYNFYMNDKEVFDIDSNLNQGIYGAFAGEDPYVLSGVPAGPVIEDVEVPASVAKGKELNVTVKIGISK